MSLPLTVNYINMPPSEAMTVYIRARADKLARANQTVLGFHVDVVYHEMTGKQENYRVRLEIIIVANTIVVEYAPPSGQRAGLHEGLSVVFDMAADRLVAPMTYGDRLSCY